MYQEKLEDNEGCLGCAWLFFLAALITVPCIALGDGGDAEGHVGGAILLVVVLGGVVFWLQSANGPAKQNNAHRMAICKRQLEEVIVSVKNKCVIKEKDELIGSGYSFALLFDRKKSQLILIQGKAGVDPLSASEPLYYPPVIINSEQIVEVKIVLNDDAVMEVTQNDGVERAVVGGLLFGGAGAIVGASSASQTSTSVMKKLSLHMIVTGTENSSYELTFLELDKPVPQDSEAVKPTLRLVREWYGVVRSLIFSAQKLSGKDNSVEASSAKSSDVGESTMQLKELIDMHEKGYITDEEFHTMKAEVLSKYKAADKPVISMK